MSLSPLPRSNCLDEGSSGRCPCFMILESDLRAEGNTNWSASQPCQCLPVARPTLGQRGLRANHTRRNVFPFPPILQHGTLSSNELIKGNLIKITDGLDNRSHAVKRIFQVGEQLEKMSTADNGWSSQRGRNHLICEKTY